MFALSRRKQREIVAVYRRPPRRWAVTDFGTAVYVCAADRGKQILVFPLPEGPTTICQPLVEVSTWKYKHFDRWVGDSLWYPSVSSILWERDLGREFLAALPLILAAERIESTSVRFINILERWAKIWRIILLGLDSNPVRAARVAAFYYGGCLAYIA